MIGSVPLSSVTLFRVSLALWLALVRLDKRCGMIDRGIHTHTHTRTRLEQYPEASYVTTPQPPRDLSRGTPLAVVWALSAEGAVGHSDVAFGVWSGAGAGVLGPRGVPRHCGGQQG